MKIKHIKNVGTFIYSQTSSQWINLQHVVGFFTDCKRATKDSDYGEASKDSETVDPEVCIYLQLIYCITTRGDEHMIERYQDTDPMNEHIMTFMQKLKLLCEEE